MGLGKYATGRRFIGSSPLAEVSSVNNLKIETDLPIRIPRDRFFSISLNTNVPRSEVPRWCEALSDAVLAQEHGLCSGYEPHYSEDKCICHHHWHLDYQGQPHGLLVSLWMKIGPSSLTELMAFVSAGQGIHTEDDIVMNATDLDRVVMSLETVFARQSDVLAGHCDPHYVCWFLEGLARFEEVHSEGGITILPSCSVEGSLVTPLVIEVRALNSKIARDRSFRDMSLIRALFELVSGNLWSTHKPPKTSGDDPYVLNTAPEQCQLRQMLGAQDISSKQKEFQFLGDQYAKAALKMVTSEYLDKTPDLLNSLLAYTEGQQVGRIHPVLAGIAYFASVSSLAKDASCKGDVTCSKCGLLRDFRHKPEGEVNQVIRFLSDTVFKGRNWPSEDVRKCLQAFHRTQRSAFVHQAHRVFADLSQERYCGPLWPSVGSTVHEEIIAREVLSNVRQMARLLLLYQLKMRDDAFSAIFEGEMEGFKIARFLNTAIFNVGPISISLQVPRPAGF